MLSRATDLNMIAFGIDGEGLFVDVVEFGIIRARYRCCAQQGLQGQLRLFLWCHFFCEVFKLSFFFL